eukprot:279685_1
MSLTVERNKRSKCLITLFAILPSDMEKASETLRIFSDLSNNHKTALYLKKDVYLPPHQKDDLFGTIMAVCDLKQKEKHHMERKKNTNNIMGDMNGNTDDNEEDLFWYLELSGKEILYHKHQCLIRNVDYIPISSNFDSLLNYLGHKRAFSYIQEGHTHYIPHFEIHIHVYSIQQIFDSSTKVPIEKHKQIIELECECKDNMQKTEEKLIRFSKIFEHLHFFKIQPSNCKQMH